MIKKILIGSVVLLLLDGAALCTIELVTWTLGCKNERFRYI